MKTLSLLLFLLTTSIIAFAQDPVKVDPMHYCVLFENAHMRVLEYRDEPGDKAPMHSHPAYICPVGSYIR
jgi:beta-alanine degradation protein BauB